MLRNQSRNQIHQDRLAIANAMAMAEPVASAAAFVDLTGDTAMDVHQIYIPGRPVPKKSVKWGPGRGGPQAAHWYQPGSNVRNNVREAILDKLPQARHSPIFSAEEPVTITVWFLLPRPVDDFKSKSRIGNALTKVARAILFAPIKPDLDNLLKHVLDACTGCLYKDDRQVVKIEAYKQRDNHELCAGGTVIQVSKFTGSSTLPNNYWTA